MFRYIATSVSEQTVTPYLGLTVYTIQHVLYMLQLIRRVCIFEITTLALITKNSSLLLLVKKALHQLTGNK